MWQRALKFIFVGGLCAATSFFVYELGLHLGASYIASNIVGWLSGVGFGFALNRRLTFRVTTLDHVGVQAMQFVLGSFAQLSCSTAGLALLVSGLQIDHHVAFVINTGFWAFWNFLWLHFVFRARQRAQSARA